MNHLLQFASDEKQLPETSSLLTLCRAGATRCFVFHNQTTDELMPFASVQLAAAKQALYAQIPNSEQGIFHFEAMIDGGLSEAIRTAKELTGHDWSLLSS